MAFSSSRKRLLSGYSALTYPCVRTTHKNSQTNRFPAPCKARVLLALYYNLAEIHELSYTKAVCCFEWPRACTLLHYCYRPGRHCNKRASLDSGFIVFRRTRDAWKSRSTNGEIRWRGTRTVRLSRLWARIKKSPSWLKWSLRKVCGKNCEQKLHNKLYYIFNNGCTQKFRIYCCNTNGNIAVDCLAR